MNFKPHRSVPMFLTLSAVAIFVVMAALVATLSAVRPVEHSAPASQPAMGWNSWYAYGCKVDQADVLRNARALVSTGLAAKGYNTVVIDDCWMTPQRVDGRLQVATDRFPRGMAWLSRQVRSMGLRFGLYLSAGYWTCGGNAGSYGHYAQDIEQLRSWHVSFIKLDNCFTQGLDLKAVFASFGRDLRALDPGVTLSQELPVHYPTWMTATAATGSTLASLARYSATFSNSMRVANDETPGAPYRMFASFLLRDLPLAPYARNGYYNDLDLLLAGVPSFGFTAAEARAQVDIWAMESSPLVGSVIDAQTAKALGNPVALAADRSGAQGRLGSIQHGVITVTKPGFVLTFNTRTDDVRLTRS